MSEERVIETEGGGKVTITDVENPVRIEIVSFDPLKVTFPGTPIVGDVMIMLPEHHYTFLDLSMDGIIPGKPHIGADGSLWGMHMHFPEPVGADKVLDFIVGSKETLMDLHAAIQSELDNMEFRAGRRRHGK